MLYYVISYLSGSKLHIPILGPVVDTWGEQGGGGPPIILDQNLWKCSINVGSYSKIIESKNKA